MYSSNTIDTLRFVSAKDTHIQIPIYWLPASSQLQWRPNDRYGLTAPTMMSTTNEEPFLPFPTCHPLPLIGSNEEVVCGPAPGTPTNDNSNGIVNFRFCRYCGIFADFPVHSATKGDRIAIAGHKWRSVFKDKKPAPNRQGDSPRRTACYSCLGLALPDEEGMVLPAFDALTKEVSWELQTVEEFEDAVVVRAGYMCATNDRRQHWHRDRPLTHKTLSKAVTVFEPCNVGIPADASCGRYVHLCHKLVLKPWYKYPLDGDFGDMVVFTWELLLCSGAAPVGLAASTRRAIASIALANYILHYNNTMPISPPIIGVRRSAGTNMNGEIWAQWMPQEGLTAPARMPCVPEGPVLPNPWNRNLLRVRCNTYRPDPRTL